MHERSTHRNTYGSEERESASHEIRDTIFVSATTSASRKGDGGPVSHTADSCCSCSTCTRAIVAIALICTESALGTRMVMRESTEMERLRLHAQPLLWRRRWACLAPRHSRILPVRLALVRRRRTPAVLDEGIARWARVWPYGVLSNGIAHICACVCVCVCVTTPLECVHGQGGRGAGGEPLSRDRDRERVDRRMSRVAREMHVHGNG